VERNYKDTTNGARTLTAKTLDGSPVKSLKLGAEVFFERGVLSGSSVIMLYSMKAKMSTTFL
jgi:hypothetical protein